MNKSVFYFYTEPNSHLHLIFKCESKVDNKKQKRKVIDTIATEVFKKFLTKYKKELVDFNGNFSQFRTFSSEIDEIVKAKNVLKSYELKPDLI